LVLRGTLARESLHLSVLPRLSLIESFAWVDEHLPRLPGSGIVYASTVKTTTGLADFLISQGHAVAAYHGQLPTGERQRIEEDLRANRLKAVVATSALGMGYDKPDLGFVIHVGSPGSPVDYYQQVGRAGRALDTAQVILIPTPADEDIWRYFASASIPREDEARTVLATLADASEPLTVPRLAATTGVRDNRLELLLKVLAVDDAVRRTSAGWESTGVPWEYDRARYAALLAAREHEAELMRSYARSARCLDGVLREALDDPSSIRCGRCSSCTGALPAGMADQAGPEHIAAAQAFLRGVDVILKPRLQWAPGLPWSGRIQSGQAIESGRALAFADDPGWPQAARLVQSADGDAPDWIVEALVAVLTRWRTSWPARPTVVVPIPSTRHPQLIGTLAEAVSQIGRIPVAEALEVTGAPSTSDLAAKARAAFQTDRLALLPGVDLGGEVVLLVDDRWQTGWTATLAGALLRRAGASRVLPLVVHQQP
jgi:ATP-dependent DNA helicase RecQ